MQANLARFEELNAHVLGISVDSVYSHQAFAQELGGITFPLLADFHPKGGMAKDYGLWREERGYSQRAIVIVDSAGVVRHSEVFARGLPEVEDLLRIVKGLAAG